MPRKMPCETICEVHKPPEVIINKPTKQISAQVRKDDGSKQERSVRGTETLGKLCHNPFEGISGVY